MAPIVNVYDLRRIAQRRLPKAVFKQLEATGPTLGPHGQHWRRGLR